MRIYKFRDLVDGHSAFILAASHAKAEELLMQSTSLKFKLVESKDPSDLKKPLIIRNDILPF